MEVSLWTGQLMLQFQQANVMMRYGSVLMSNQDQELITVTVISLTTGDASTSVQAKAVIQVEHVVYDNAVNLS